MIARKIVVCFVLILVTSKLLSQTKLNDLDAIFDMSIEDMMNVKVVSSSFTGLDKIKTPASITVISQEDIAITPYRNLYDLIEVYVPAAIWMTHYDSPHIGIRGLINQRNDKILLLVNGKNMNFKARNGATSELENWDLSDIEQIEIIRGPGSVIYGPGAVEAVINIKTNKYSGKNEFEFSLRNYNPYNSLGGNIRYNQSLGDNVKLSAFASVINTSGYVAEKGYMSHDNRGSLELGVTQNTNNDLQEILVDSYNTPQIKAYLDLELYGNTNIWARYTRAGSTINGLSYKSRPQIGFLPPPDIIAYGEQINFNVTKNEQFVFAIDNKTEIFDNFFLKSSLSFDSENNHRTQGYLQSHPIEWMPKDTSIMKMLQDPNSLRNRYFEGSESEIELRMLLLRDYSDNFSYAFGFEYSYNFWGKSWFNDDGYFRFGDNWNIISDTNSPVYNYKDYFGTDPNDTYFVGNGWSTNTFSILGETNYEFLDDYTILISGRLDKDDYSEFMFSPRFALIWGISDYNYLKFIAQRSLRMNTAEELLIQNLKGQVPTTEALDNLELIYTSLQSSNFIMNISAFYSNIDMFTWKDQIRSNILSGTLKLAGIEFESRYHNNTIDVIFNHSFIKQISWDLMPGVYQSGISYSDYYYPLVAADSTIPAPVLSGVGNDLNNLSNHTTKIIFNYKVIEDYMILHLDSRIYWNFEGAKDGLQMIKNAIPNSQDSENTQKVIDLIEKYDTYGMDFRLNASLLINIMNNLNVRIFGMNLLDLTNNRRLNYDSGNKREITDSNGNVSLKYLFRTSLIVEPLTLGFAINFNF